MHCMFCMLHNVGASVCWVLTYHDRNIIDAVIFVAVLVENRNDGRINLADVSL